MKNKHEQIAENLQKIEGLMEKGLTSEVVDQLEQLMESQMEILTQLDVNDETERDIMKKTVDKNKEVIMMIQKKQTEVLEQIGKMSDTQENKKNYDLYK